MDSTIYLGHSGINAFYECKRLFKNKYMDKIPSNKSKSNKYFSFDQSIHNTLAKFNEYALDNEKSLDYLLHLLNKNWISRGYSSLIEENQFKYRAINVLTNYFNNPLDTEIENIVIDKILHKDVGNGLILKGKVDKLYRTGTNLLEIVDYKTGNTLSPSTHLNLNTQIAILIFLIYETYEIIPDIFSYYFLIPNRKFTINIDKNYIDYTKEYISLIVNQIAHEQLYDICKRPCNKLNCAYYNKCSKIFN